MQKINIYLATFAALLGGCKVGPNYRTPQVSVPPAYHEQIAALTNPPSASITHWWTIFNDPQLDTLIREAAVANHDVRLAQARVREARAQRGVARSALFPSLDASGDYSRARLSQNAPNGFLARGARQPLEGNSFISGFDMNWEIDIFGGQPARSRSLES